MTTIKYRADIDGLRAIAVLAVIAFHACPAYLPGGFIGVDMFFVISGYLISGIIYKAEREGTFSYADFYARRVRRIFPALLAAVALCLAYGWLVLLPTEYEQLGGHVAAGAVFLQNVAFWNESGYFDTSASLKPLLHLWSLAVEEQIYLVFPPLVLFALWMRWPMVPVLAVLLVASFAANLFMAGRSVSADFFLTPFRAWEFLGGAILAWIHDRRGQSSERSWLGEAASWTGVLLLAAGMAWITDREPYPGWRAVVPVVGTLLVIAAGRFASFNRWALSLAPVVWVGLISYPLYLFHWPLISFVHIIKGATPDPKLIAAAVALSFVLAVATYYCLERQLRHSRSRWTVPLLLIGFLILGGVGAAIWKGKLQPKPPSREVLQVNQAIAEAPRLWEEYSAGYQKKSDRGIGVWRIGGTGRQTLFFGDSTMMMMAPRIQNLLNDHSHDSRGAIFIVGGGLCPVPGARSPIRHNHENLIPVFEEEVRSNPAIDRVVISGLWQWFFSTQTDWSVSDGSMGVEPGRRQAIKSFGEMIDRLVQSGKQVTVVLAVPIDPKLDPKHMYSRGFLGGREVHATPLSVDTFQKIAQTSHIDELEAAVKANGGNVIDPVPSLSRDGICISTGGDGPIRYDNMHLRARFARDHVTYLDATVADGANILANAGASTKKTVEAPSASARPTQWKIVATKDYPAVLSFPDTMPNAMRVEFGTLPNLEPWRVRLASQPAVVQADAKYRVSFRIRADKPREVIFTVREAQKPWTNLGLYGRIPVTDQWQSVTREFTAKADASNALFSFDLGGSDIAVEIADISFGPASLKPSAARAAEGPRPNLLFIIFDDLNDSVSGMGGHPQAKTPNIARLMARGVRFTNAHCSSPICGPSRASLLTGLYPHTSGYFGWEQQQHPWRANPVLKNTKTFIQHAVAAGYTASGGGKIFHNGHEDSNAWRGRDGVDRAGPKAGHGPFATPADFGLKFPWILNEYGSTAWPGYMAFGSLNDVPVIPADPTRGFPGVRGWADYRFVSDANRDPLPDEQLARWAADQLAAGKAGSPFMMCIGFNRPHQPEVVPQEYFDLFPLDSIQIADRLENDLADCAAEFRGRDMQFWTAAAGLNMYQRLAARGDEYLRRWTQAYLASVAFADAQLGLVLDALAAGGQVDNTLVVLTSDHGYHMGQKDYVFKNTVWEPSTRVPLVVAGPGVARNAECKAPVTLIDIYPTLIDYGRMPGDPHGPLQPLDGHGLRPLLEDPGSGRWDGPPVALTVATPPRQPAADLSEKRRDQNYTIRGDRYRYVRGCRGGEELYDHLEDPHEWRNLAADSEHRATLEKMRKQMDAVLGFRLADELTQHQSDADVQPISDATSPATGDQRR